MLAPLAEVYKRLRQESEKGKKVSDKKEMGPK